MGTTLITQAQNWLQDDPHELTRRQLEDLIVALESGDSQASEELADAFRGRLEFGTAGLRGKVGPGPNRMNLVVVARAAAGLAAYLNARGGGTVVIGHDARHGSELFADASAQILTGAGLDVVMLPAHLPTPLLAFSIRHLGCAAGIMVTASHNPAPDNGYKVYLGDGMQIVPPADAEISAFIDQVTLSGPVASLPHGDGWTTLGDDVVEAYVAQTITLIEPGNPLLVRTAYTPLHGVGGQTFLRVMAAAGLPAPAVVTSQFEPDPDFGGMPFPNPEESGVMDAVLGLADQEGCDLAIAHDPDADRCAFGVPAPDGWRMLSGDEVGWLLGWWIAAGNRRFTGRNVFAQSIVSGTMLEAIAEDAGLLYARTLTGFKWIARVPDLAYGYEEALGYCVHPTVVSDKDGISAALMMSELVGRLTERGASVLEILDELAERHGVYATGQVSVRHADPAHIVSLMTNLREQPPASLGGLTVVGFDDLENPQDGLPPTDGVRFILADGGRVIVRPSGTEAKVKSYLQVRVPVTDGDLGAARSVAERRLGELSIAIGGLLT